MKRIKQTRPNTRRGIIQENNEILNPHDKGQIFGIFWKRWKCTDRRIGPKRDFNILFLKYKGGDIIPGKRRVRSVVGPSKYRYKDKKFHYVEIKDGSAVGRNVYQKCFYYMMKRNIEQRGDPLSKIQSTISSNLREKKRNIWRKRRREKRRFFYHKKAAKMFGCALEQVKSYQVDAVRTMGDELANRSCAHR